MPFSRRRSEASSSSGVVSAMMRPSCIRMTRSTSRCSTSSKRCSMMMTVVFVCRLMSSISSIACLPVAGSRFASGSSNSRIGTLSTITPASDTRCFCPPDSSLGAWLRCDFMSTKSATSPTRRNSSRCSTLSFSSAKAMSSATVRPTNWPSASCSTVPTIFDTSNRLRSFVSFPRIRRLPCASPRYENGMSPLRQCASVDLPQPEGPQISTFSPSRMVRVRSCSVGSFWALYCHVKFWNSMTGLFKTMSPQKIRADVCQPLLYCIQFSFSRLPFCGRALA